ncbi:type II toxin-antitoxin system RelE/ParE family toxin [Paucihalobacter ruber]|uniref:Toxin n=1 Tax=Paucihalobacter ruber TaxID=2567861 RepID=A0A506PKJ5_9FLAO|nr:type II toxin-antitoxin system RelE/ParE family toxin [Paucihalobacter ruber]TPV33835.1 type II toxin-antitoxin system RelE/ParE family toxin [Paucihalobacter ruber]
MKYKISREAHLDLENIWLYTFENWSKEQADRYINLIIDEIEYLAEHPDSGQNYENIRKGYFRSRIKSHFIFYKNNHKISKIEVIRILHQRMDIKTRLTE